MVIYRPGKDATFKIMPPKDPDAVNKPYTVLLRGAAPDETITEQGTFLTAGVSITEATITSDDPLLTISNYTVAAGYVVVWLSGGTVDSVATVTIHFVTDLDNGIGSFYEDDVSFKIPIKQR